MRFCPACHLELADDALDDHAVGRCPQCAGLFVEAAVLERFAGGPVRGVPDPMASDPRPCPQCEAATTAVERGAARWRACEACGGAWLTERVLRQLAGRPASTLPPPAPSGPVTGAAVRPEGGSKPVTPMSDRLPFGRPIVQLLAYPIAALIALVVGGLGALEILFMPLRIWIHELGHALPAWLSGRAALPLPIGFTFWKEESSWFTAACMFFLIGVFGVASLRERRAFGIALAAVLLVLQVVCTFVISDHAMIEYILAGGLTGELVLSTFLIVAFYYPLPDRFRWDFWRFVVLIPAAIVFASAYAMWVRIDLGTQGLPLGSILGAPGDGTGDVDRLLAGYDWTPDGMATLFRSLGTICLLVIGGHYAAFGLRSYWQARARRLDSLTGGVGSKAARRGRRSPP